MDHIDAKDIPAGAGARHTAGWKPGGFRDIAIETFIPAAYLGWAACWIGAAHSALARYVSLVRSPGRPRSVDPKSELFTERLARIRIELELAQAYLSAVTAEVMACRTAGRSLAGTPTQIHLKHAQDHRGGEGLRGDQPAVELADLNLGYRRGHRLSWSGVYAIYGQRA